MSRPLTIAEEAEMDEEWERLLNAAPLRDWDGVLLLREAKRIAARHTAAWRRWHDWLANHRIITTLMGYRVESTAGYGPAAQAIAGPEL